MVDAGKMDVMLKVGILRSMPCVSGSLKVVLTLAFVASRISEGPGQFRSASGR